MPILIHNKSYVTVAERVAAMHDARNGEQIRIDTHIDSEDDEQITVRAYVTVAAGSFCGHARSNKADRSIEGQSPLEVAETSAVGRALGFAGFGVVEGIASADEVKAAQSRPVAPLQMDSKQDTPAAAALRKLYAVAKEKGMDHDGLLAFLETDSVNALAKHMMEAKGDCGMGHPHGVKGYADAYQVFTRWVEQGGHVT